MQKPGSIVSFRNRDWTVLPSSDEQIVLLKPLGGSEEEIVGVFEPLTNGLSRIEEIKPSKFPEPSPEDLGDFDTARLIYEAARLSFRNASGPFMCVGKLSFRPRAYQMIPMIAALKQEPPVRMMIADDVGVGKTVEALLILKEMTERRIFDRFAVICPPHLCEQWQAELRDKLDVEAEIIRSSTASALDRKLPDDRSVFWHVPHQVISIDYVKQDKRKGVFLADSPDLIIVDEAHSCALPKGSSSKNRQMRHSLIRDLADIGKKSMILLTATPHSGKDEEFQSLLGFLDNDFQTLDFANIKDTDRKNIAAKFIQRKRGDIEKWLGEVTPFPKRDSKEIAYKLTDEYAEFFDEILSFARGISKDTGKKHTARIRYWAALALMRGVMSSPAAGLEMLKNRKRKKLAEEDEESLASRDNPHIEKISFDSDSSLPELIDYSDLPNSELKQIDRLCAKIAPLASLESDLKAKSALNLVKRSIKEGFYPIVFCKYIATAQYLGEILKENLPGNVDLRVVTSDLADEQRKEVVADMGNSDKRVLVATDCLSEGINLQDFFTAVVHYDLPWNPNRLEQREGRVDRFGQTAKTIKTFLLWSEENPIDNIVLKVLIRKVKDIQKAIGVSIAIGEDNSSIMDEVLENVLFEKDSSASGGQIELFGDRVSRELETAKEKALQIRNIFSHDYIKPGDIEKDLRESDEAVGDPKAVESFVVGAVQRLGGAIETVGTGDYKLFPGNMPNNVKDVFDFAEFVKISFRSPTPKGFRYIGRNHKFVERLCRFTLASAVERKDNFARFARCAEIVTDSVDVKTVILMLRMRITIEETRSGADYVAEEMRLWGFAGSSDSPELIDEKKAAELLFESKSLRSLSEQRQKADLDAALELVEKRKPLLLDLAADRSEAFADAGARYRKLLGGEKLRKAEPVLPPDILGIYVLIPNN